MYHHQNMNMEYNTKTKFIALKFYNIPIPTSYIVPEQFSIGKTLQILWLQTKPQQFHNL